MFDCKQQNYLVSQLKFFLENILKLNNYCYYQLLFNKNIFKIESSKI